jgi:hypothetical protein
LNPISERISFTENVLGLFKKIKLRKTKTYSNPNSNKKCGHWSPDEHKRYHWFLEIHNEHFFNKCLRRTDRIFKTMANFVETREAEQCRSHHQKMEKKHKYFQTILLQLRLQNYGSFNSDGVVHDLNELGVSMVNFRILS